MIEEIIKIQNVSKIFKLPHERRNTLKEHFLGMLKRSQAERLKALQEVSFNVKKGEFLGIIGRNGSGKSTLLKIIAGILKPNSGRVIVNGTIAPFLELGVGFQGDLSARDNVYLYGAILGLSRSTIDGKFSDIIKFAELERFVDQKLKNFSSGMQVRLAFATAIQAEADILLVDEVLAVGDLDFRKKCYDVFKRLRDEGKTIIFVSHDLFTVNKFCHRVILLESGKMVRQGTPAEVIEFYQSHKSYYQMYWNELARSDNSINYILPNRNEERFWLEGRQEADKLKDFYDSNSIVLEIGVGVGRILKYIGYRAKKIIGIDVSQEYLNQARVNFKKDRQIKSFELFITNGCRIPVGDKQINLVYSINTFLHLQKIDIISYIQEAKRVLIKDGTLYMVMPNELSDYYKTSELAGFTHRYSQQEIKEMMMAGGFNKYKISRGRLAGYADSLELDDLPEYIIIAKKE
ncbi:MAG: ATP-binding cassette domain-containing protein [Patescibacteria group bacterium]|jgi:lipopolysaccharide transport system ATP-binding protein